MIKPHCRINNVKLKRLVLPAAFKTQTSCHVHNPYGGCNDYYVRRDGVEPSGSYRLASLKDFVRATR